MFKIYGGATKFTQWTKDQKLIMSELPIGADVLFYNDPNEDEPTITEVYEIHDEEGNAIRVCDVPNIFLTETKKIKVRIPKRVRGLYGTMHSIAGQNEKYFEVEPAEKPSDYVYEKTVTNTIDPKRLPEGYPYVGEPVATEVVPATTLEFDGGGGINDPFDFAPTAGLTYLVNWNGVEWECVAQVYETMEYTGVVLGDGSLAGLIGNGEPFAILYIPDIGFTQVSQASGNVAETITISITEVAPIIHTINEKFLPNNIFTVIFKYYNGSVECHASYEQIENALIGGKEIKAKMVFSSNDNPDAPMLFVGLDSYTGGGYQFIHFNVAGSERQLIIYTCLSDGSGWKEERLSLKKAAYVANAAGETVTAAEFNALLTSLKSAGILATS